MSHVLEYSKVSKRFGGTTALDGFDLACGAGSVTGLVGPNGSGKSTALALAAALLSPTSGRTLLAGREPMDKGSRRLVGYLPQQEAFHRLLTVGEVVDFAVAAREATIESRDELSAVTGVGKVLERRVGELSGGWARRLALFSALVGEPALLLLDEPFVGLDPDTLGLLTRHLEGSVEGGATLLVASHDFEVLDRLAPRIIVLDGGRVRAAIEPRQGASREIYRRTLAAPASESERRFGHALVG